MIPGDWRPHLTTSLVVDPLIPRDDNAVHRAAVAVPRPKVSGPTSSRLHDIILNTVEPPESNWTTCTHKSPKNSETLVHSTMQSLHEPCAPNGMRQSLNPTCSKDPIEPLLHRPFSVGGIQ